MYSEILLFHCCWLAIWLRHYYANCCLHFWLFAVHENALEYLKKEKFCLKLLLLLILKRGTLKGEKLKNQKICPSGPPYFSFYFSVNHAMEMIIVKTRNRYLFVRKRKCKHCSLEKRCPIYHDQDIGRLVLVPQIECRQDPKNWSNGQKQNFWPAFDWKVKRQTVLKKALINDTATLHVWGHSVEIT